MIDFVTFGVTLPHPTIEAMLCYWIIGSLVYMVWMAKYCCINGFHINQVRAWWVLPATQATCIAIWPYLLWEEYRDG